jgi:hypothetical protein
MGPLRCHHMPHQDTNYPDFSTEVLGNNIFGIPNKAEGKIDPKGKVNLWQTECSVKKDKRQY